MKEWQLMSKLCFVQGNWAYFTTLPVEEQWGDDWDDAPYEHNAGEPYDDSKNTTDPMWLITKVAFDCDLVPPCSGHLNSPYTVRAINTGAAPWLRSPIWTKPEKLMAVQAGTTLAQFIQLIKRAGGTVYTPVE